VAKPKGVVEDTTRAEVFLRCVPSTSKEGRKVRRGPRPLTQEAEMIENWRDIAGYEKAYQVSNLGRVRSLDRVVVGGSCGPTKRLKGRVLKPYISGANPYQTVAMYAENKPKRCTVHRLVAAAFLGPCPSGHEVCHGPNGKQDNRLTNLSYGTRSQNQLDRYRDGTTRGRPVRRSDGKEYLSAPIASRETGVSGALIWRVCTGYVYPNGRRCLTAGGFRWEFI
jgi:hypothetical protein